MLSKLKLCVDFNSKGQKYKILNLNFSPIGLYRGKMLKVWENWENSHVVVAHAFVGLIIFLHTHFGAYECMIREST